MYEEHEILSLDLRTTDGFGTIFKINQSLVIPPSVAGTSQFFPPSDGMPSAPSGAKFYLVITAVGGTNNPTLQVLIIKTIDGQKYPIGQFTPVLTIGTETIDIPNCPNEVQADFFISGTAPEFTFRVHCSR